MKYRQTSLDAFGMKLMDVQGLLRRSTRTHQIAEVAGIVEQALAGKCFLDRSRKGV